MKNYLMFALLIGAASTVAFGQTVTCDGCTHDVSVYMGEGGLVAESDAEEVVWVTTCDGVTVSGELEPNDDGKVSMLFDDMNGLACHSDKGSLQLGPIMDGGWYWITDDMNSAVGGLVGKDIQDNDTVDITSAGEGVTMTAGKGAVYLKETATGRVGILPNILAEPPTEALRKCGAEGSGTAKSPATPVKTKCELGDGKTQIIASSTDGITGTTKQIMDKGTVMRPSGSGSVEITVDVWGNGTGHYVAAHSEAANGFNAFQGQPAVWRVARAARLHDYGFGLTLSAGGPGLGGTITSGTAVGGVDFTEGSDDDHAVITVEKDANYCSKTANYTATVYVTATTDATDDANQVVPSLQENHDANPLPGEDNEDWRNQATMQFDVVCPAASASSPSHEGVELIPDNLFPTDR